jgi:tetratricopeptide (TPR) repeat protein
MVKSCRYLGFVAYFQNIKKILGLLIIAGLMLPGISEAVESEIADQSRVKINIINFLYIFDAGLDVQMSQSQEIERTVIFPAIEKVFEDFGVSNYSLQYEQVSGGNLDYSDMHPVLADADEQQGRLVIWGMVTPLEWPEKYDLTLIFYMGSQPVYSAIINVRQGMITSWNQQNCQMPLQSLGLISAIQALKIDAQNNVENSVSDLTQIENYIKSMNYKLPSDALNFILNWKPDKRAEELVQEGMLNLMLERGGTYQLEVDKSYKVQLESFLTTNKKMNWYLGQSSLLMPEIKIGAAVSEEVAAGEVFREPVAVRHTPRSMDIGIVPFANESGEDEADWLGFGLEYLLANKFSNIAPYKLIEKEAVIKFVQGDSATVHVNGHDWSLDYSIGGGYNMDGDEIEVDVSIAQAFSGVRIASEHYKFEYEEFFDVVDDAAEKFIRLTEVLLTESETKKFEERITNSMPAFEYFCLGYLENARSDRDMDLVISNFKAAVDADSTFWGAYYNLGTAYYNLEMYEEALAKFNYIIENIPSFELAYLGRGLTYLKNSDYPSAYEDFIFYLDNRPYDYRGWYYAGRCALQMKQYPKAMEYLAQVIELQPLYSRGYFELGNAYYATNRFEQAILNYNHALELEAELIEARRRLGESYYHRHSFILASSEFKKLLTVIPDDPEVNFMMGITVYKLAALNQYIDEFLELYGISNQDEIAAKKQKNDSEKQHIYDEIISYFNKAQSVRSNFFEATFNLALTYQELGQPDSALKYYNKTLEMNPELVKVRLILARFYERQGKYDMALEEYKKAVRIDPGYFINYSILGPENDQIDVLTMVRNELEQDIQIDPDNITNILSLANLLYVQGFKAEAAKHYRRVLILQPEEKKAKDMLSQM